MKLKTKKKIFSRIQKHILFVEYSNEGSVKEKILKPYKTYVKGKQLRRLLSGNTFWLLNDDIIWKMPDGSKIKTRGWMDDREYEDAIDNYATGRILKKIKNDAEYIISASNTYDDNSYTLCIIRKGRPIKAYLYFFLLVGGSAETTPNISGILAVAINMPGNHIVWYDGSAYN